MLKPRLIQIIGAIAIGLSINGCGIRATSPISTTEDGYIVEGSATVTFKASTSYQKRYGDDSPGTYVSCISESQTQKATVRIATHGSSPTMPDASEAIEFAFSSYDFPRSQTIEAKQAFDSGAVRYVNGSESFTFTNGSLCLHFMTAGYGDQMSGSFNCFSLRSNLTGRYLDLEGNWSCKRLRL